jgi:DNA-binding response OmpR family regulator
MQTGRTILVVEDDAATCAMLAHRLEKEFGVTVAAAGTLQEAETLLSDESVCIGAVILDVGMPDGDGCEFCVRIRR